MTDIQTDADDAKLPPLTGSERVQRSRNRKRADMLYLNIEMRPGERDALVRMGLLAEADRNDKIAVRDALYAFFERRLTPQTPKPWSTLDQWQSNGRP
jgi:hypothetical protein